MSKRERMEAVVRADPSIDPKALAARFGVATATASRVIARVLPDRPRLKGNSTIATSIPCPRCGAKAGRGCTSKRVWRPVHAERRVEALLRQGPSPNDALSLTGRPCRACGHYKESDGVTCNVKRCACACQNG